MSDINRGNTFVDGFTTVDAAALHTLVDGATLKPEAITSKSAMVSVDASDQLLIHDFSESALRSIQYSVLSAAISASTTVGSVRKNVAQAHLFAVGDVIREKADGTGYEKAQAVLKSVSFATGDVNTTTNRITLPTNTITNGEQVILSSSGVLPAPAISGTRYFAKKIDAVTAELYTDSGLATIVDLTDVGSGTHTIYNELERAVAAGVVSATPDSSNFTVVFSGEVTGLPATLTAGKVYYLSGSSAGAMAASPTTALGQTVQPVLVATSTTAGIVLQAVSAPVPYESIRTEHISTQAVTRAKLSAEITQLLDRNIGSDRQTVLHARKDTNGIANFLEPGTGLQVVLKASSTDPCIISFANGFDDTNGYNFVEKLTSDQNFNTLTASSELFLYVDRAAGGALTYSFSDRAPEYGFAKTQYRDRHCFPRMFAADSENGMVASSNGASAGNDAYKAFTHSLSEYWEASVAGAGRYIQLQSTYGKVVNSYSIRCESISRGPSSWTLEGSNDGAAWTTLDTRSSVVWATTNEKKSYTCNNTASYKYYKVTATAIQGGAVACRIGCLTLSEAINHYYVIPEGVMYYWDGSTWTAKNRVFVGEVITGAATVSAGSATGGLFTYAIRGIYQSPVQSITAGNSAYPVASAIGSQFNEIKLYVREDGLFPWGIASNYADTTNDQLRAEIGYTLDDSVTATNTKGLPSRYDRLYTTIIAPGTNVLVDSRLLLPNGDSTSTFGEAFVIVRRAF